MSCGGGKFWLAATCFGSGTRPDSLTKRPKNLTEPAAKVHFAGLMAVRLEMFQVFLQGSTGNQMIVQVGENKWELAKQGIHRPLEGLSSVHQPKSHKTKTFLTPKLS
jgi:hypothetical protein